MKDDDANTPDGPEEAAASAGGDRDAPVDQSVDPDPQSMPSAPEPIEAEFEPADTLWKRVTDRQVSMPIALGLAGAAAVLGGFFGVVFDGGGGGASSAQVEAAVDRRFAEFDERLRELRQTIVEGGENGSGPAAAAFNDIEAELADARESLGAFEDRLRVVEASQGDGEAGAALADELAEVRRLAEEAMAAPSAQAAELEALDARLNSLSDALRAQGSAIEELSETSTALAGRVTGVRAPTGLAAAAAGATIAFSNLQDAALSGDPFSIEAQAAAQYFSESDDMAALMAFAEAGAPTPAELAATFRSAVRAAREADQPTGGGVVEQLGRAVAGLVTVRRLDAPETASVGDVIVRAQRRLANDDLAGAADELDRLGGAPKDAVATWIEQARARVAIETHLEALRSSFSER